MELLERERDLARLAAALATATAGRCAIALVSGAAGIGKTSFVEHFAAVRARAARVLKGNCDALFTPSPLAPLYDIARQLGGGQLLNRLESAAGRLCSPPCWNFCGAARSPSSSFLRTSIGPTRRRSI